MEDRTYRIGILEDDIVLPASLLVGFHADPLAAMRADGHGCPDDAYAGSFTYDQDAEDDGAIYFPHDPSLTVIVHEAAHAIIGVFHRRGLPVPTRDSDADDEEVFVHTLGLLVQEIVNALHDEECTDE